MGSHSNWWNPCTQTALVHSEQSLSVLPVELYTSPSKTSSLHLSGFLRVPAENLAQNIIVTPQMAADQLLTLAALQIEAYLGKPHVLAVIH